MPESQKKKAPPSLVDMLKDPNVPLSHRLHLVREVFSEETPEAQVLAMGIVKELSESNADEKLAALLKEMEEGALRCGTFVEMHQKRGIILRARVKLEDGTTVFPVVPEAKMAGEMRRGDPVLLDAQARAVLYQMPLEAGIGEEAVFERRIGDHCVEVSARGDDRYVFDASQPLIDALDNGDVEPGCRLLVCPRRSFAFSVLPVEDELANYSFLDKRPVPSVSVERDLGAPPPYIDRLSRAVWLEMTHPELRRSWGLRRCSMTLLAGISGSGKTYSLMAFRRRLAEIIAKVTGIPVDELPPRVLRIQAYNVLSKWLGDSDKAIARAFTEAEQLADQKIVTADGREVDSVVLVVLEEIDALTRQRGGDNEGVYDRILSNLLVLLDPTREELRNRHILFIATTNLVQAMDIAFVRRIGGTIEYFGRLDRRSFVAVARKLMAHLPFAPTNGYNREQLMMSTIRDLVTWFYSPNGEDQGQVELTFAGSTVPEVRYRRDFLTAGLVDRAVQQAAQQGCDDQFFGCDNPGLTPAMLRESFEDQINAIVSQLRVQNAAEYLEVPQGTRVQNVRPLPRPTIPSYQLLRAS